LRVPASDTNLAPETPSRFEEVEVDERTLEEVCSLVNEVLVEEGFKPLSVAK
jgi:hypothetical protein